MTVEEALQRVGAYVDQDTTTPTDTDLLVRMKYLNNGLDRWAITYDWTELKTQFAPYVTQASAVSISLPTDFKKMDSALYVWYDTVAKTRPDEFAVVDPSERFTRLSSENFSYLLGDRSSGYTLIVPKGLSSGASVTLHYQKFPASLVTLNQNITLADPMWLVKDTISQVLESRGDARFPQAKQEAERTLMTMIEHEQVMYARSRENTIPNYYTKISRSYRTGRD